MDARAHRALVLTIAILGVALTARVAAACWWQSRVPPGNRFQLGDSESYWSLARAIARSEPYEYGPGPGKIFRTPGYPLILSPLFLLQAEPPVLWARLEGAALGTLAVAAVMWLTWSVHGARSAYLAGAVSAGYPGAIGSSVLVLSEAPYCPLVVAQVACWLASLRAERWKTAATLAVVTGGIHGMATLMRPSHLLFVPFAVAVAMLSPNRRRHLITGALVLAASCLALAPWWYRNYQVTGRFVATTLQLGASLYDGWNPNATGASDMRFVDDFVAAQRQADAAGGALEGTFEERLDLRLKSAAITWAEAHPGRVLHLAARKFARMWSPLPNAAEMQSTLFRIAIAGSFVPILCAAVFVTARDPGGFYAREGYLRSSGCAGSETRAQRAGGCAGSETRAQRAEVVLWCWLPALYLTGLHVIFVSSIRYREPAMLTLICLAAGVLASVRPLSSER